MFRTTTILAFFLSTIQSLDFRFQFIPTYTIDFKISNQSVYQLRYRQIVLESSDAGVELSETNRVIDCV